MIKALIIGAWTTGADGENIPTIANLGINITCKDVTAAATPFVTPSPNSATFEVIGDRSDIDIIAADPDLYVMWEEVIQ